ncbi:MAG TPA: type I-C CRISPR-associated protein Cas8c/Csd1, partial [Deltaproteobacteria bacterium]|nr:type I-C CRISPR-associated protein Cas8c/Csd1 [Deltaproteobacteria bacterium]
MILSALSSYYERLKNDPESGIPLRGFSRQKIHFCLVLDFEGSLVQVQDLRETIKGKPVPKALVVPEPAKKSVNIVANFMWGNTGYVLGADEKEKPERALQTFEAFRNFHHQLGDNSDDAGMKALLSFLDHWSPDKAFSMKNWDEMAGSNLVFRLDGALEYLHDRPAIKELWIDHLEKNESGIGAQCL